MSPEGDYSLEALVPIQIRREQVHSSRAKLTAGCEKKLFEAQQSVAAEVKARKQLNVFRFHLKVSNGYCFGSSRDIQKDFP